jgi:hypothetical protein
MILEDCYIYWDDESVPEQDRYIYFQCVECHNKNGLGLLWLKTNGYAEKTKCWHCDKTIYDKGGEINEKK